MTKEMIVSGLECYRATVSRIENLEQEIEKWKTVAMSLGNSIGSGMPSAHNVSNAKYTKAIETLADIEMNHIEEISMLKDALKTTSEYISLEKIPHKRIVLQMRYIDGLSVAKIAKQIDRSVNTVYKILNTAINDIVKETRKTPD